MTNLPSSPASGLSAPTLRLPAARAGDAYRQPLNLNLNLNLSLSLNLAGGQTVAIDAVEIPADLALTLDPASGVLSGTPAHAGEYTIAVTWHAVGTPTAQAQLAQVQLVVNPDPKTLWREQPSDQNDRYWRPDHSAEQLSGAGLRVLAASKRGRSHAHVGSFRDDAYAIDALPATGWAMAIAADGAGSARYSHKGAAIICDQARETLRTMLAGDRSATIDQAAEAYHHARAVPGQDPKLLDVAWQTLRNAVYGAVGNAAYYAAKGVMDEATQQQQLQQQQQQEDQHTSVRDYASTALIAICKRYPFGTLCAAYWVGDGAVGIYSARDGISLLGEVDSGEYSGQTRFLDSAEVTQEALLRRTRFELVDHMTALVVMTDGVSDARFETDARLARADDWHLLWQDLQQAVGFDQEAAEQPQKLLDWLDFWSQGNHDERTIALIY